MAKFSLRIYLLFLLPLFFCSVSVADDKTFTVVLDAGHGGKDPGAIGSTSRNREKDINLGITLGIGKLLEKKCSDIKVIYTRKTDVFVELGRRAEIANKAKADLFISIHTNALPKNAKKARGVQSYTLTLRTAESNLEVEKRENSVIQFEENGEQKYSYSNPNSSESDIMFELMQDRDMKESVDFAKLTQNEMVRNGGRIDMGVLQANLAVLRLTYMPSVLLEVGYISTPSEEQFLLSKKGQEIMSKCIYNAIVTYKNRQTGRMSSLEKIEIEEEEDKKETTPNTQTEKTEPSSNNINDDTATSDNTSKSETDLSAPIFKIQIMSSNKKISCNSKSFKGLQVEVHQEGGSYKYTCGSSTDYNEINKMRKDVCKSFPGAFITAYKNGERIDTQKAIQEFRNNKK